MRTRKITIKKFIRYLCKKCKILNLIYQEQLDKFGNILSLKPFFGNLNQKLMEMGRSPFWIITQKECHNHWSNISNTSENSTNTPNFYAQKDEGIVKFLINFWSPFVSKNDSIFELGSSSGKNLEILRRNGYHILGGGEINPFAVKALSEYFPDLATIATVIEGPLEKTVCNIAPKSWDVLFTMATAIHIHPKSNFIFKEMVRIARKYICLIEIEYANCNYVFSRNYKRLFEKHGCQQINLKEINHASAPYVDEMYYGYIARLFKVPDNQENNP